MRRIVSFVIPLGCTVASLAAVAACEDDPNPQAADFDAQAPTFDANRPPTPDGSIPDASVPDVDAGPAPVTVLVKTRSGQAVSGASVVFGAANGDVLQTVTSDATGTAAALVPSGAQVTVVFGNVDAPRLVTITAVEPGDVILASDLAPPTAPLSPSVEIGTEPDGGAYYYRVASGSCGSAAFGGSSSTPFLSYGVFPECIGAAGKVPVFVEADDDSFTATAYQFSKGNVAPTDGGVITPTLGAWSSSFNSQTVNVTNIVVDGGNGSVLGYGEIADGVMKPTMSYNAPADGGVQGVFKGHAGYPDAVQFEAASHVYLSSAEAIVGTATREAPPAGDKTTNIDFATRLPEITSAGIDAGTPQRPAVAWTPVASLAAADGTYVIVTWYEAGDASQINGTWSFVTPANVTSVVAPKLPANIVATPGAGASFGGIPRVVAVEASFVNGYAEFRKGAGVLAPPRAIIQNNSTMLSPPLPVNGTVKFSAYTVNGD